MRVLLISHTYVVGVNQQKVAALASLDGLEVGLVAPKSWRSAYGEVRLDQPTQSQFKLFPISVYGSGKNDRFFFNPASLFKTFRDFKPDLVHIEEEPWSAACLQSVVIARTLGVKSIFFTWENLLRAHKPHYQLSQKSVFSLTDGALAGNSEAKEILEKQGFQKPVVVLPQLGVDLSYFKKRELPKEFTVGFIGRFDKQKGIMTLLEALEKLTGKLKVLLVGGGTLQETIEREIKKRKLENFIEIRSGLHHDKIPEVLAEMSVLVLPSETTPTWKEQFGHVLIEAMASGRPVIGSDSGAIPEVVSDGGLIFPEGDSKALAQMIEKLQTNKDYLSGLAEKAYKRVKENYTHEIIAKKTLEFYQKISEK